MSAITDLVGGIVSGLGDTAVKLRTAITGKDRRRMHFWLRQLSHLKAKLSRLKMM